MTTMGKLISEPILKIYTMSSCSVYLLQRELGGIEEDFDLLGI